MKKYLPKKMQKGTSLIELLLYFALLSIILLIAVDLMIRSSEFSSEAGAQTNLQEDARFITNRLACDIHQASAITTPANLGQITSSLTLTLGAETHTYTLVDKAVEYRKTVGPDTQIANLNSNLTKINSLSFQRLGNVGGKHTIKITFEIEELKTKKGGSLKKTFETVVGVR